MGRVLTFPAWQVVTRDEGSAPGDPRALLDPSGRRHDILEIVRRRLVATIDPGFPVLREIEVRTAAGPFLLTWTEDAGYWAVAPL